MSTALQQDPQAILAAHLLDPGRRDLFVEGAEDRRFLTLLAGTDLYPDAAIREIDTVNVPGTSNKQRLLDFAALALAQPGIRCFADADNDRINGRPPPANLSLTDHRDLEHYLLDERGIEKIWSMSLAQGHVEAGEIRNTVLDAARTVGVLRLMGEREQSCLPFQRTDLAKRVDAGRRTVSVDLTRLMSVLLQNDGRSLSDLDALEQSHRQWTEDCRDIPSTELAHGKDCVTILGEMIKQHGVTRGDAQKLTWAAFDRRFLDRYPSLRDALQFVCRNGAFPDPPDATPPAPPTAAPRLLARIWRRATRMPARPG